MIRAVWFVLGTPTILLLLGCNPAGVSTSAHLLSVRIVPAADTLTVGEILQFGLSGQWSPGAPVPTVAPRFFGDDASIASVDLGGKVTARTPGQIRLTGCIADTCDSRLLTVTP